MSRARATGALLLLLLGSGCGRRVESSECQQLLDHYVELLLRDDRPKSSAGEVLRIQQEARKKAQRDPAFSECSSRVSRRGFDCAMQAEDANRLEQCLL
ncbi:MAG: hypothetical protein K0R38_2146 [Polyangiaceae bacterium]|jgi:hypothetical protein|nr:hypothetical protein [Polyangiaceae bacterium]